MKPELRKHQRKDIRLPCIIQFSSGITAYGYSKNIGLEGVSISLSTLPKTNKTTISRGDVGLLTLRFSHDNQEHAIKAQCQVSHIIAHGLGLAIRFYDLDIKSQKLLQHILSHS